MTRASVQSQNWLISLLAAIAVIAATLTFSTTANAEVDTFLTGNGQDGAVNFGNGTHRPNAVAPVPAGVTAGATSLVRGTITAGSGTGPVTFANNRLVMIYQANGWSGTATSGAQSAMNMSGSMTGKWEFARISTVAGTTLNFTNPIVNTFDAGSTQVIAVPEYTTVTVSNVGANVTGRAWDGTIGGAVVILANSTFNFTAAGVVQADVLGFRGGVSWNNNPGGATGCTQLDGQQAGGKGEGIFGAAFTTTTPQPNANQTGYGNYLNGGGGGDCFNAGGGGGSNGGLGGRGGNTLPDYDGANPGRTVGGYGGLALTYNAYDRMVLGGGGGAGDRNNAGSGNGGRGGGLVFVRAASLSGTGTLRANAGNGEDGDDDGTPYDGAGGGGAGGVVYLRTTGTAACTAVAANGGNGGNNGTTSGYNWTPGAGGSGGYVYIQKSGGTCNATVTGGTRGTNTNTGQVYGATSGAAGSNTLNATALAAPTVTLAAPTNGSFVVDTTPAVSGTSTANATINVYVDGTLNGSTTANGAGNWTYDTSALSQGSHTVRVQAELAGIYSASSGTNSFTVDTVSPAVSISSPANGSYTTDNTPSVTFTATDANFGTTTCSVDAGAYSACSSIWTTGTLADGLHSLNVRHTDLAGNVSTASVSITVDTTFPVVSISSLTEGAVTNDNTPSFTFSATDANLGSTTCSVDGGAFGACSSPYTTGVLSDGAHNIRVRHADLAGNTTTTPQRNFTVDTTAPVAPTIVTGPSGSVSSTSATFTFTGEAGGTYECRMDGGSWTSCSSGVNYSSLGQGSRSFEVRQIDDAGNTGPAASRTWTVDTVPPAAPTINSGPTGTVGSSSANFTFTPAEPGGTVECQIDSGAWTACSSPVNYAGLTNGPHTFNVRQTDAAGNVGSVASQSWTVDTTAPAAPTIDSGPAAVTSSTSASLAFTGAELGGTFECRIDGGSWTACTSPTNYSSLLQGGHTFDVRQIDGVGNTGSHSSYSWTVDTTPPTANITPPPALTNSTASIDISFTTGDNVAVDTVECQTNSGGYAPCTSPYSTGTLQEGNNNVYVRVTDTAGNVTVQSVSFTVDSAPPSAPAITSPTDGAVTNDTTPTLSGTAEANSTVEVFADGNSLGTTTADGSGNWSFTPGSPLSDATYEFTATSTDAANNTSVPSNGVDVTIDTTAPNAPAITSPADGSLTGDNTPTISGTAEANSTVEVFADGNSLGTTTADGSGNWSFTPGSPLSDATYEFTATSTDAANNTSVPSNGVDVTIDTTAPAAPVISSPTDGAITNDTTPTISGTAEANSIVEVFADGNSLGTTTADGSGNWSFTPVAALAPGTYDLTATSTDAAGNESVESAPVELTIDVTTPTVNISSPANGAILNDSTPTIQFTAADDSSLTIECSVDGGAWVACGPTDYTTGGLTDAAHSVSVRATDAGGNVGQATVNFIIDTVAPNAPVISSPLSGTITNDNTPTVSGTAEANSTVIVYADGNAVGSTVTDGSGNWSFTPAGPQPDGTYDITATSTDAAGNVSADSNTVELTIDTSAPAAPAITSPADGTVTSDTTPTVSGTAEANSTVEVFADGISLGTTTADGTGNWSFTPGSALADGDYEFTATSTDAANNTSVPSAGVDVTIDTGAPAAPVITSPADGTLTNDSTPTISGTAEADSTVEVFADGVSIGTTTADGSGNWSFTPGTPLSDDTYEFTATATDTVGNEGPSSAGVDVTIDTTAPTAPAISSPADGTVTNDTTPTISGTAEAGSTVEVFADGNSLGTTTADGSGNWSFTPGTPLGNATYEFTATATDAAGNESAPSNAVDITVDTVAPAAPVITSPIDGSQTNDTTPTISGTAEPNSSVDVYVDGNYVGTALADGSGNWSIVSGVLAAGDHTITAVAIDAAGNPSATSAPVTVTIDVSNPVVVISAPTTGAVLNDSTPQIDFLATDNGSLTIECSVDSGAWVPCGPTAFTTAPLLDGTHDVTVRATDSAGNAGTAFVSFIVDTAAPAAPTVTTPADGSYTTDSTPTFGGTAEPNSSVTPEIDGMTHGPVMADGSGNWSYTPSTPLSEGPHDVRANATDEAGNAGPYSGLTDFTIDASAPSVSIGSPTNGSVTNDTTPDVLFTATDDNLALVTCSVDGGPAVACVSPFNTGVLTEGPHSVTVTATDFADNTAQQTVNFTVDTSAPDTEITANPTAITSSTSASFSFTSEVGATFECSVNGAPYSSCSSPQSYVGLPEGPNTFEVRAIDAAGNADATPATYNWTIDTTAPSAPVITGPADGTTTGDSTPTISGTAEPNSTVTVYVDGNPVGTTTTDGNGDWTFTPSTPLADGPHIVSADAEDTAGNTSAASTPVTVTIDTTAPATTIDSGPNSPTSSTDATITFSSDEPGVTYQCSLDGAAFATCTSPLNLTGLSDGPHTLEVRAIDQAGNVDPTPASYSWTVDTTPPSAPVVTAPTNGGVTNDTTPTISGTAEPGSTVTVYVDGNPIGTAVANGSGNWTLTSPVLTEGPHAIVATASDELGNTSGNSTTVNFTVDTTPPDGAVVQQNGTGNPAQPASFTISSDDPDATTTCSINGGTPVSCGTTFTATGLAPGSYTLEVVYTDEAGNTSTRTVNFTVVGNPTPPPTTQPVDALPAACFPKGITIYELAVKGGKLNIKGFARSQYVGKEVTINFQPTKTKVIGKTTVQPDGSFSLTVKAPPKKQQAKGSSRYRANVGGESSLWFKLARRMGSNLATYSNGKLNVAGALTKPLDPKAVLTVTVRTGCNDPWAKVGTTKVGKSGSFKASMPLTTDSKVLFVRMYAKVRKSAKGKATLTTYSFVVPVVTGR